MMINNNKTEDRNKITNYSYFFLNYLQHGELYLSISNLDYFINYNPLSSSFLFLLSIHHIYNSVYGYYALYSHSKIYLIY